jgi:hypothetical protein
MHQVLLLYRRLQHWGTLTYTTYTNTKSLFVLDTEASPRTAEVICMFNENVSTVPNIVLVKLTTQEFTKRGPLLKS